MGMTTLNESKMKMGINLRTVNKGVHTFTYGGTMKICIKKVR